MFAATLREHGHPPKRVRRLMKRIDIDGDGKVTWEEFAKAFAALPPPELSGPMVRVGKAFASDAPAGQERTPNLDQLLVSKAAESKAAAAGRKGSVAGKANPSPVKSRDGSPTKSHIPLAPGAAPPRSNSPPAKRGASPPPARKGSPPPRSGSPPRPGCSAAPLPNGRSPSPTVSSKSVIKAAASSPAANRPGEPKRASISLAPPVDAEAFKKGQLSARAAAAAKKRSKSPDTKKAGGAAAKGKGGGAAAAAASCRKLPAVGRRGSGDDGEWRRLGRRGGEAAAAEAADLLLFSKHAERREAEAASWASKMLKGPTHSLVEEAQNVQVEPRALPRSHPRLPHPAPDLTPQ